MIDIFLNCIHKKQKIRLTFYSKEDGTQLIRKCAPMDYGPSRRAKDKSDRFHFWDYESDKKVHTLSLLPGQVVNIEPLDEYFDPAEFITWDVSWFYPRDWGKFS